MTEQELVTESAEMPGKVAWAKITKWVEQSDIPTRKSSREVRRIWEARLQLMRDREEAELAQWPPSPPARAATPNPEGQRHESHERDGGLARWGG